LILVGVISTGRRPGGYGELHRRKNVKLSLAKGEPVGMHLDVTKVPQEPKRDRDSHADENLLQRLGVLD
jgi:hypothetical protein